MIALIDPRLWLAALLLILASFGIGWHYGAAHEAGKEAKTVIKTITVDRKVETAAVVDVNAIAGAYQAKLSTQKEKSDHEIKILKAKLAATASANAPVPSNVIRLLDPGSTVAPDDSTTGQQPSDPAPATNPTYADELEIAARNYREVCIPNAEQLEGVQRAYNAVRGRFNNEQE